MTDEKRLLDRRAFLLAGAATAAASAARPTSAAGKPTLPFPRGFLWGAATSGHQVEGNNVASDLWLLEQVRPTAFRDPSGDACNSFELWPRDLDLVKAAGLNTYRFSLEWSRIEPEPGQFSAAMLDHYRRMIEGCRERGLAPIVTFNHFTSPRWFAARGGWLDPGAPERFTRFCERAARALAAGISHAVTLNEPNLVSVLNWVGLPKELLDLQRASLLAAAKACGTSRFSAANVMNVEDVPRARELLLEGHRGAVAAIKGVRPDLPVGVSLAIVDDEAVGPDSRRDAKRAECYEAWLQAARTDDFIGVQNYERSRIDANGPLPPPPGARRGQLGAELHPPSLAGTVRYAHAATGRPVLVTEHGVATEDDADRAWFIPEALAGLHDAIQDGVPVLGYVHWSLLDNFEWIFGYGPRFGLHSVDRSDFTRIAKPSAAVLGAIARRNGL